ncbi:MAG: DUF349 domain-containing protein [Fibrobacter sp.]|nr:DUF349 domain-containing protein [Fibrobacter sp.]
MGLFDLFKPEWQKSDVEVRKDAVIRLKPNDQAAIESVALNDSDSEIRGIAIRKLNSTEVLKKVIESETDASNKRDAENRLLDKYAELLKNFREVPTQNEHDAVTKVANTRVADDLLKSMPNSELRLELVQLTTRQSSLEYVALKEVKSEIAQAALERLERSNMLQNVFQNSRHTSVRQKAGEKLREVSKNGKNEADKKDETALLFHKREAILQQAQRLADSKDFMENEADFNKVLQAANELGMGPAQVELDRITDTYNLRRSAEIARIEKANAEANQKSDAQKRLEGIVSDIDKLLEGNLEENKDQINLLIASFNAQSAKADNALLNLFKMSVDRFNKLTEQPSEETEESKASRAEILAELKVLAETEDASKAVEHKVKLLAREWEKLPAMEGDDPELQSYNALRNTLSEKFNSKREADEKIFNEKSAKLQEIIEEVKKIDDNSDFKIISQKLRDSYKRWKEVVADDKYRYKEIWKEYQEATSRFKEMQEWESWHNENDRESLIEEMTALTKEEPSKELLLKLRTLANQWKAIGPVSAARVGELRDKFRTLFEEIMKKCEPFIKEQEEERKQNLALKEAICEQVDELAKESDVNWRDKYKTMQELQEKWKTIGMVPKENVQPIWDRFRAAENAFFAKHKEFVKQEDVVREANYQKKLELCEKAEKLAESTDWNAASTEFRKLQEDWKKVGPAPRSKSEEIWNRFRTACDNFFDRKRSHFEEMDSAKQKTLEAKEALCAKLEALDFDPTNPETVKAMEEGAEEWKKLGMVPKDKVDEIWNRYSAILDKFAAKRAEVDPEYKKTAEEAQSKKEAMITTVSQLMETAGSNQSADAVKNLQSEWSALPRCGAAEQELYKKFRNICDEFFTRRRDQLDIQEQARENNLQNKIRLCEEAERLLEGLTDENRRDAMNEVKQLRRHWREIGAVPRKESDKIWNRFNSACDAIFGKKSEA